jgi:hypothetical protein
MSSGHWPGIANVWQFVGPPLRPAAEDLAAFQATIDKWHDDHKKPPRALILGVTPEIYSLKWPMGTQLNALDGSPQMIDAVWPGKRSAVIIGSWTEIPFRGNSMDIVLCDGGFGMLRYPDRQIDLLRELHRIISIGGALTLRLFAPSGRTGDVAEVFAQLSAGQIASLDALKLRLWGALHGRPSEGVKPRKVVETILELLGDFDRLAADHGWTLAHVRALELHRQSLATYYLTEAEEFFRMACSDVGGFQANGITWPAYELGDCCPTVSIKRIE